MFVQRTRQFVNTNTTKHVVDQETLATPDKWFKWFLQNKSVNTLVHDKTYAEVLLTTNDIRVNSSPPMKFEIRCSANRGSHSTNSNATKRTDCVPCKCVQPQCILTASNGSNTESRFKRNPATNNHAAHYCS